MVGFRFFSFASGKKNIGGKDNQSSENTSGNKVVVARPETLEKKPPDLPVRNLLDELLSQNDAVVALELLAKIVDESQLAAVVYRCRIHTVAVAAAEKLGQFELILKVLRNTDDKKIGKLLLDKIVAKDELSKVAASARSSQVRRLAGDKLSAAPESKQAPGVHDAEYSFAANKERIGALENICTGIEKLWGGYDESAHAALESLCGQWEQLPHPPPRFMEILEKRFHDAVMEFRRRGEESLKKDQQRQAYDVIFSRLAGESEKLASAAGDFVGEQWKKLKNEWERNAAVAAPPEEYRHRYAAAGEKVASAVVAAAAKLQSQREQLGQWYAEIEVALTPEKLRESSARMKELRSLFEQDEIGTVAALKEDFSRCRQALNLFFTRRKDLYEAEEYERCANLVHKQDICHEAAKFLNETDMPKVALELKRLHGAWREAGRGPRDEDEALNSRFREICDELHRRCDEYYNKLRLERLDNLEVKKKLAEQAEALKDSTDWHQAAETIKFLQQQWKVTGPGPKDEEPAVYQRFKDAGDSFFVRRRQHLDQLKEEWERNATAKRELIEEAGKLIAMDQREAIVRARELRHLWKQSPAADHRTEQELWELFNGHVNRFFAELDAHQAENIARKEELCVAAAAFVQELSASPEPVDYHAASRRAEELLNDWKKSGPVPREKEVEIWDRFDASLKQFYDLRRVFLAQLDAKRAVSTGIKQQLLVRLEDILSNPGNLSEDAERIKVLQREWKEAGPGEPEQEKDLWQQFHELCDGFFTRRNRTYEENCREQQENCRRKLELCVRMEKLAGIAAPEDSRGVSGFSVADELTMALQSGGSELMDNRQSQDMGKMFCEDWRRIGFSGKGESKLQQRFFRARDAFFKN